MNFWWVNHSRTHEAEIAGSYLWSPQFERNGRSRQFYNNMTRVSPGDVVFSHAKGEVSHVGIAYSAAVESTRPDPVENLHDGLDGQGWCVGVHFVLVKKSVSPKKHMDVLASLLPEKYSPLDHRGNAQQGAYLCQVSPEFSFALLRLLGQAGFK